MDMWLLNDGYPPHLITHAVGIGRMLAEGSMHNAGAARHAPIMRTGLIVAIIVTVRVSA